MISKSRQFFEWTSLNEQNLARNFCKNVGDIHRVLSVSIVTRYSGCKTICSVRIILNQLLRLPLCAFYVLMLRFDPNTLFSVGISD